MTQAAVLGANASIMTTPVGTAPGYQCRAWVNFNGTGTVAIRASGNVTSITDNGTGRYIVNMTTAMPDTNFNAVNGVSFNNDGGSPFNGVWVGMYAGSTSTVAMVAINSSSSPVDVTTMSVSVFR